jgi:hypothetical protein
MISSTDRAQLSRRIEEVALNAWPAPQRLLYDGWLLAFASGYTKRANSVSALYASRLPLDEKITLVEQAYHERGLPPIYRLTPHSQPPQLDEALAQLHPSRRRSDLGDGLWTRPTPSCANPAGRAARLHPRRMAGRDGALTRDAGTA